MAWLVPLTRWILVLAFAKLRLSPFALTTILLVVLACGGCLRPTSNPMAGVYSGTWSDGRGRTGQINLEVAADGYVHASLDSDRLKDALAVVGHADSEGKIEATCRFTRGTKSLGFVGTLLGTASSGHLEGRMTFMSQSPLDFAIKVDRAARYVEFASHPDEVAAVPAQQTSTQPLQDNTPLDPYDNGRAISDCPICYGKGQIQGYASVVCEACNGRGSKLNLRNELEKCIDCDGSGRQMVPKDEQCWACKGAGRVSANHSIELVNNRNNLNGG